jgi:serine/threonine-protein kinase ATR
VLAKANQSDINAARNQAAEQLGGIITTASKDSYYRFYEAISNLHVLHELDMLLVKDPQKPRHNPSRADLASLTNRLDLTAPSFQTREAILNMRRNAYRIR